MQNLIIAAVILLALLVAFLHIFSANTGKAANLRNEKARRASGGASTGGASGGAPSMRADGTSGSASTIRASNGTPSMRADNRNRAAVKGALNQFLASGGNGNIFDALPKTIEKTEKGITNAFGSLNLGSIVPTVRPAPAQGFYARLRNNVQSVPMASRNSGSSSNNLSSLRRSNVSSSNN